MEPFRVEIKDKSFNLYPVGDWHLGSVNCDERFIAKVINQIKDDPKARWVGMGDLMENALVGSQSDIYTQIIPPKEQMDHIVDILDPVKKKGLFLIAGNHEQRTMRLAGIHPEVYIATRLELPFLRFSCYARFVLTGARNSEARYFTAYFHHNYGGGYTKGGKVNRADQLRRIAPTADAIFSGHFHITSRIPTIWYELGATHIHECTGFDYITGSALTWNVSYAEEKAKPAAAKEHICVEFIAGTSGHCDNRRQEYRIISQ